MRSLIWTLMILAVCFVSGGATCMRRDVPMPFPPTPTVLNEAPSLQAVAAAVNRTSAVRQLSTNSASVKVLSMPRVPELNATLSLERDKNFRLQASLPVILGAGMDMGSNQDVFWFEVPESMGMLKTLYYAQHEQYRQQLTRAILPVDPTWVMDALGLVQIDPTTVVAGPVRRADGRLEIRSTMNLPGGLYQRVCLIHASEGYVTHQFLYAPDGKLIASSQASRHQYYEAEQCVLPHEVTINLQPAVGPPLAMKIEVSSYTVNQLLSGDPQIFTMPQTASRAVDLTKLTAPNAPAIGGTSVVPGTVSTVGPYGAPQNAVAPMNYSTSGLGPMPLRGTVRR